VLIQSLSGKLHFCFANFCANYCQLSANHLHDFRNPLQGVGMVKKYPYLDLMKSTWFVRLAVPADVQPVIGAKVFKESTHESDPDKANAVAAPILAGWRRRIQTARGTAQEPLRADFRKLAAEYQRLKGKPLDETGAAIVLDVIGFVMSRIGGQDVSQVVDTMGEAKTMGDVFLLGKSPSVLEATANEALGLATPFLTYLADWQKLATQKGKTLDQMLSTINKFGEAVTEPMETLSGKHVQKWLDEMVNEKTGKPADKGTKQRKLSDIRPYWKYLQNYEHVSSDSNPFDKRTVGNRETDAEAALRERRAFKVDDVPTLWEKAIEQNDQPLADLIQLAAYSGARLGELMNLTSSSIIKDDGITCIHIIRGKTRNARRVFPVHPAIQKLVKRLDADRGNDGFLVPCGAANRADTMSKRFGRMKTEMGFDGHYTFHCLRHTVIEAFRNVHCPLEIRNRIVGHEDGKERVNTGGGYGGLSAKSKLEWIERAIRYPT
jgi:integrase